MCLSHDKTFLSDDIFGAYLDCNAGLPDDLFSNQKAQIWGNFGGPFRIVNVGIFHNHSV
jgi:hypothetical protein